MDLGTLAIDNLDQNFVNTSQLLLDFTQLLIQEKSKHMSAKVVQSLLFKRKINKTFLFDYQMFKLKCKIRLLLFKCLQIHLKLEYIVFICLKMTCFYKSRHISKVY